MKSAKSGARTVRSEPRFLRFCANKNGGGLINQVLTIYRESLQEKLKVLYNINTDK